MAASLGAAFTEYRRTSFYYGSYHLILCCSLMRGRASKNGFLGRYSALLSLS